MGWSQEEHSWGWKTRPTRHPGLSENERIQGTYFALLKGMPRPADRIDTLERGLAEANRRLDRMSADLHAVLARDEAPVLEDSVADWIASHADELRSYQGSYIAVHPKQGVVGHGRDLDVLYREVRALKLGPSVAIDFVPE